MNLLPCIIFAWLLKDHFIETNDEGCMKLQINHLMSIV